MRDADLELITVVIDGLITTGSGDDGGLAGTGRAVLFGEVDGDCKNIAGFVHFNVCHRYSFVVILYSGTS